MAEQKIAKQREDESQRVKRQANKPRSWKNLLTIVPAVAWAGLIFYFSHQSADSSDSQSGFLVNLVTPFVDGADVDIITFIIRKAAHFFMYFVFGVLVFWAVSKLARKKSHKRNLIFYSILIIATYAALDETHQLFIPERSGQVSDVILDSVAGAIGILLTFYISNRPKKSLKKTPHRQNMLQ